MTESQNLPTIAGYDVTIDDNGGLHVDSMDGRIWHIIPEITVTRHSDGSCGARSSCSFLAGGGRTYAPSIEAAKAMCPPDIQFDGPDEDGHWHADDGTYAYGISERYRVMCGDAIQVRGKFTSLLKARGAVVRLIGTAFGY